MKLGFIDLIQSQFTLGLTIPNMNGAMIKQVPNIPAGILANMPQQVHDFLAYISVEELHTAYDATAVVYSGFCRFDGTGSAGATPAFQTSNGSLLQLQDLGFQFRITIPRQASTTLRNGFTALGAALAGETAAVKADFKDLTDTLAAFVQAAGPTDYPNIDFRIELLFNTITLHLPAKTFIPARLNSDGWLEKDPDYDEVKINLPKIALIISQNADNYNNTQVRFGGWGINSLDDAADPAAGEMISMTPALCLHSSGIVGFGLEKIVLDLSADFTPSDILEKNFGVGDDFTGLWIPSVRLFIAPAGMKGLAVDTWAQDMLIDFDQGLSGEFGIEVVNGAVGAQLDVQTFLYQGKERREPARQGIDKVTPNGSKTAVQRASQIAVAADGRLQLRIRGGKPVYTIAVKKIKGIHTLADFANNAGTDMQAQAAPGQPNANEWLIGENAPGSWTIYVKVSDGAGNTYEELLQATLLNPGATSFSVTNIQAPLLEDISPADQAHTISLASSQPDNDAVFITTNPGFTTVTAGGNAIPRNPDGTYRIPCARDGVKIPVTVAWQDDAVPPQGSTFDPANSIKEIIHAHGKNFEYVYFGYDSPGGFKCSMPNPAHDAPDSDAYIKTAASFYNLNAANLNSTDAPTLQRLTDFLKNRKGRTIQIYGYASYEHHNDTEHLVYNDTLSHRRARTLIQMLEQIEPGITASIDYQHTPQPGDYQTSAEHAKGDMVAKNDAATDAQDGDYHVAVAYYPALQNASPVSVSATVHRPKDVTTVYKTPVEHTPPPDPPQRSEFFRRIAVKVRFQRNKLVMAEVYGRLDFGREAEVQTKHIQNQTGSQNTPGTPSQVAGAVNSSLGATNQAVPSANPVEHKGMVDFRLAMVYNEATRKLTQTLELGFDKDNLRDGLLSVNQFNPKVLANTTASLLLFAPLLQAGIESVQSAQTTAAKIAAMTLTGVEFGLATVLGIWAIQMDRLTLFGGELSFTETSPDIWIGNAQSLDEIGILFDYGVQFKVNIALGNILVIKTNDSGQNGKALQPPFVRYKAIGFKLNFENNQVTYKPVFDTSKGYELSLGDPGALQILVAGKDIGNLLKVLTARLAKENPFLLEADLALGINLGIITVDRIRITVKIDDGKNPVGVDVMVIPTKVSVNIPGALIGSGYLDMGRPADVKGDETEVHQGFRGSVDLTLVPLKLRIAASLGIGPVSKDGRTATAFFLGLEVELPAAIPLGGTGIGIFGFLGLFGMHYKRSEKPDADDQLPPALRWFDETVHGNVIDITGWEPELDRWSFGLGIILGTMEGGFVLNLKGMFMLELPGPRILIFVKAVLLFPKPKSVKNGSGQTAGILAVIDLDFNIGRLTIGLVMQYEIESVLKLRVPVDAQFNFEDASDWHVYIGSNKLPAEALILGIVRGYAYLMFAGNGISDFPEKGQNILKGFSIAVGLGASIIFGDKDDGLYLEVAGDFKAGIGFSPLTIVGQIKLRGELHLWVVSISAWADLNVLARTEEDPANNKSKFITRIHGEACGKVNCLLFDVEGCVTIDIGPEPPQPPPARLVKTLTLVSRSSALIQGQGVDRPINGAVGRAFLMANNSPNIADKEVPTVSIDSIPALDLVAAPDVSTTVSFTNKIPQSPNAPSGYWVDSSDGKSKVRYTLQSITLDQPLLDDTLPKPANWWPQENDKNNKESGISLALLCWTPDATPHAVQQSEQLTKNLEHKWGTTCDPSAPVTSVFWTFNQKPLGYSPPGWKLYGTMWPDPPGTVRSTWPSKKVFVYEPAWLNIPFENRYRFLAKGTILEHAKVIGTNASIDLAGGKLRAGRVLQFPVEHAYQQRTKDGGQPAEKVPDDLIAYFKLEETERIFVECQPLSGGNILLAVDEKMTGIQNIIFRTLDKQNKVIEEKKATDFTIVMINSINDLPLHWKDPAGPWYADVSLVMTFMALTNNPPQYKLYLINYQPGKQPVRFSITAHPVLNAPNRRAVLLCALELTEAAEMDRHSFDQLTQDSKKEILIEALKGDQKRALLKPGTQYKLGVTYNYDIMTDNVIVATGSDLETFVFKTDDKAPLRIDPWIMATTPQKDMMVHFVEDPVQIIFNDDSVFQLYLAYGHELKVTLRKANGNHPDPSGKDMNLNQNNQNVAQVPADIKPAFQHALEDLVAKDLPCVQDSGQHSEHTIFKLPIPLMRNTAYTMEIESKTPTPPPPGEPYTPLYKVSFTTSRFLSMQELAGIIRGSYVTTRVLKKPLASLATPCSDNGIQQVMLDAGLDAIEPASDPQIVLLWAPDGEDFALNAILIDSPEPLWRQRTFPFQEIITDDEGKTMTHWIMKDRPELEITADAGPVLSMAYNLTGTRTLIYMKPGAAGQPISLHLKQYFFVTNPALYGALTSTITADILNISLPALPPWVENE